MSEADDTKTAQPKPDRQAQGMQHESDIGSGEPSPGQQETDEIIKAIPPTPKDGAGEAKQ